MKKTFINVKTQEIGFHCWPDAPEEVNFLRNLHRHVFHVSVTIEVFHDDRELEFFLVQNFIRKELKQFLSSSGKSFSCERIADYLLSVLRQKYNSIRYYKIEVSEDNENSGIIEYTPEKG